MVLKERPDCDVTAGTHFTQLESVCVLAVHRGRLRVLGQSDRRPLIGVGLSWDGGVGGQDRKDQVRAVKTLFMITVDGDNTGNGKKK